VAFAVEGDGVGFATESYAASALYTTLASLSGALWRIRRARSLRVLLVDDDILVSMGAADMLLDLGHTVAEAQSGAHALRFLESDSQFDIVVTDYAMPGMNGFELAQRIKERHPKLPIILATGYAELPADRPIEFGHLSKPYSAKDLAAALERAVNS